MKRSILCLFFSIAYFLAQPSQGGPLRSLVRSCPGGVCPATRMIEVPVEAIVAPVVAEKPVKPSLEKVWGVIGDRPGACPTCPRILVYGWIEKQPTEKEIDAAASRLAKGGSSPEEEKRLAAVIDAPALNKAIRQEWSLGSCGMVCRAHGSSLYDVYEDGTVEPATGSGSSRGVFRRRR